MARAYSLDLRERVVGLVASGETCRAVGELYDVSVASRREVVAAGAGDGQCGGQADGRQAALPAGGRARLAAGTAGREA